jgi:hypothetical protein
LREVEGEAVPPVARDAGGDGDQVAPDGSGPGLGMAAAGEGSGCAQEVAGDRGDGEPGGVGGELSRWQVGQGAVAQVGDDLLDDRVAAMLLLGLDQFERGSR